MEEAENIDVDVMNMDAGEAATSGLNGWLEPLDWSLTDRAGLIKGAAKNDYVASEVAGLVLGWNTGSLPNGPAKKDWSALLDTQHIPGKRGIYKQASQTLEVILLGAGVKPANLYPLDVDRALAELDKIRPDIVFWDSGASSAQLVTSGEVALV